MDVMCQLLGSTSKVEVLGDTGFFKMTYERQMVGTELHILGSHTCVYANDKHKLISHYEKLRTISN